MRKSIAIVLFLSAMLVCMPSCITNKSTTLLQTDDKLPQYPKAEYEYYRIRPNDWLVMRVLTLNEESYEIYNKSTQNTSNTINGVQSGFRVYDDGTIDIPFIDGIPVAGLTVREAAKAVQDTCFGRGYDRQLPVVQGKAQYFPGNSTGRADKAQQRPQPRNHNPRQSRRWPSDNETIRFAYRLHNRF